MKVTLAFLALISVACSVPYAGIVNTGASTQSRSQDNHGNYAFAYNEDHATGGTFREEQGGHGVQVGSYGLRDADGRHRVVKYVADALGFRASVQTNEPGVDPKRDPAAVTINGGYAPLLAAPIVAPVPAPLAYGSYGGYNGYNGGYNGGSYGFGIGH